MRLAWLRRHVRASLGMAAIGARCCSGDGAQARALRTVCTPPDRFWQTPLLLCRRMHTCTKTRDGGAWAWGNTAAQTSGLHER
jgi:hypothetical protein